MVPLMVAMPFGPLLAWKRGDLAAAGQRLFAAAGAALLAGLVALLFVDGVTAFAAVGFGLAAWLLIGAVTDLVLRAGIGSVAPSVALRRFAGLPRSVYGTALAHFGLGLTALGIVSVTALQQERIVAMKPGDTVEISGYVLRYDRMEPVRGPNYTEDRAFFGLATEAGRDARRGDLVQTRLYRAPDADHRGRDRHTGVQPGLCLAGRSGRERRDGGARLAQAAGDADLARRAGDDGGRNDVAADRRLRIGAPARRKVKAAAAGVPVE
jgi:cytochrome c-type biogenesis protein CcmF